MGGGVILWGQHVTVRLNSARLPCLISELVRILGFLMVSARMQLLDRDLWVLFRGCVHFAFIPYQIPIDPAVKKCTRYT